MKLQLSCSLSAGVTNFADDAIASEETASCQSSVVVELLDYLLQLVFWLLLVSRKKSLKLTVH